MTENKANRFFVGIMAGVLGFLAITSSVHAQTTYDWKATSSFWEVASGWSPSGPPGANDTARFSQNITDTVNWFAGAGSQQTGELQVLGGNYTFAGPFTGVDLKLNSSSGSALLISGASTTATFRGVNVQTTNGSTLIEGGATLNLDGSDPNGTVLATNSLIANGVVNLSAGGKIYGVGGNIGGSAGTTGIVSVFGSGSQWNNSSSLYVGQYGNGTLKIHDGGSVSNTTGYVARFSGSIGEVAVEGSGSTWINSSSLTLGRSGTSGGQAIINVDNGGRLQIGDSAMTSNGSEIIVGRTGGAGNLTTFAGSIINNQGIAVIGAESGEIGQAWLFGDGNGIGSQWNNAGEMYVGYESIGGLSIESASIVNNSTGYVGRHSGGIGTVVVTNAGSQWNSSGGLVLGGSAAADGGVGELYVLDQGKVNVGNDLDTSTVSSSLTVSDTGSNGNLWIRNGSTLGSSDIAQIGFQAGAIGTATITGAGSHWDHSGYMDIGHSGSGTIQLENGGVLNTEDAFVGRHSGATGLANVTGVDTQWNSSNLYLGGSGAVDGGVGTINLDASARITVGDDSTPPPALTALVVSDFGANGNLVVRNGSTFNNLGTTYIGNSAGATGNVTVSGSGTVWNNTGSLYVGYLGEGSFNVEAGAVVNSTSLQVGRYSTSPSTATITGLGSHLNHSQAYIGFLGGHGSLLIEDQATAIGISSSIGFSIGSIGSVTVSDVGSLWQLSNDLNIGHAGLGTLNVESGGIANSNSSTLGFGPDGNGTANITGTGSEWNVAQQLQIGWLGTGTLNISDGGLVTVGDTTSVGTGGAVNLTGGRFEFGTTSLEEFGAMNRASGSMAGEINLSGVNHVSSFTAFQNNTADVSEVHAVNSGLFYGSANLDVALTNQAGSELRTTSNDFVRFAGTGNTNAGEINNFGGVTEFAQDLTNLDNAEINNFGGVIIADHLVNQAGGLVGGRGQFITNSITNEGVMAFSAGHADILGDVVNVAGGQIVTSGDGTTTFYDDVVHNGTEIRTAAGSNTVFFGALSGAGPFTGTGDVLIEGDLRPGNSPNIVSFEGNLSIGASASSFFEIAGLGMGQFDQLDVTGDLDLDGMLGVSLIDDFELDLGMEFLIADVAGSLGGTFSGLGDGDWVGNYGGHDLFITYSAGNGNDVALFTRSVPEPASAGLILLTFLGGWFRRRRSSCHSYGG